MEPKKSKTTSISQKRQSRGRDGDRLTRKKRKSYSAVVEAWFETLSEAIQEDMQDSGHGSRIGASTQRNNNNSNKQPRRNAFVLHTTTDTEPEEEEDNDDEVSQLQNLQGPPPLVWDVIDLLFASEVENL